MVNGSEWGERHRRCSNENMEHGSEWTPKDRTKSERSDVIRKDMNEKGVQRLEAQDRRTWSMKTRCADPK